MGNKTIDDHDTNEERKGSQVYWVLALHWKLLSSEVGPKGFVAPFNLYVTSP